MKRLLGWVLSICILTFMLGAGDQAYGASLNNWNNSAGVSWSFEQTTGTLKIIANGDVGDSIPWLENEDIRQGITAVVISGNAITSLRGYFRNCSNLTNVSFSQLDSSRVVDFSYMFAGCSSLKSVDLSTLNVSEANDFSYMFADCKTLDYVNFDGWVLGQYNIKLDYIFSGDTALQKVDFSKVTNTRLISSLRGSFYNCSSLLAINFSNFDFSGISIWENAFRNDSRLNCAITVSAPLKEADCYFAFLGAATEQNAKIKVRYMPENESYAKLLASQVATNGGERVELVGIKTIGEDCIAVSSESFEYDGNPKEPEITVTVDGNVLTKDIDYTCIYSNNLEISKASKASVTVIGIGDYTGSAVKYFEIKQKENTISVESEEYIKIRANKKRSFTFNVQGRFSVPVLRGKTQSIDAKVDENGRVKVTIPKNFVGEEKLTFITSAGADYAGAEKIISIKVIPKSVDISSVKLQKKGSVSVKWKTDSLVSGYEIRYYTSSDFSDAKTKTIKKKKTSKATISKLNPDTSYYFQLRAYKSVAGKKYYSNWSQAKSIKTEVLSISSTSLSIVKGERKKLSVSGTSLKIKWKSSNSKVASVDSKGWIKAKKKGTVTITASVGASKLTCKVTVANQTSFDKLYSFIEKNGVEKNGNKQITNGNSLVYYSQLYKQFTFCYLSEDGHEAVEMSIPRNGASRIYITYIYKQDDANYCKSTASFEAKNYKSDMELAFSPSTFAGEDQVTYNTMANNAYKKAMKLWSPIAKEAKTTMKKLIS